MMGIAKGTRIRIVEMVGEPQYSGKEGDVEFTDSIGQIHGTWGGLAVQPDKDRIEVLSGPHGASVQQGGRQ